MSDSGRPVVMKVRDLVVDFRTRQGTLSAVDHVTFDVHEGEILGIVGESGSGKSTLALTLLGLVDELGGHVRSGQVILAGTDLLALTPARRVPLRGSVVSLVFQNPMASFNPVWSVGAQLIEGLRAHGPRLSREVARKRAIELLDRVGIADPQTCLDQLPGQFSGGMLQRAMIAIAIANRPRLIIADEPTTALDVTIQAEILRLFQQIVAEESISLIIVTHDLGVIAEVADRVMVLYAGRIAELGDAVPTFAQPRHPYTAALLASRPSVELGLSGSRPAVIVGAPPILESLPPGCAFHPRCGLRNGREICLSERPELAEIGPGRFSACHFQADLGADGAAAVRLPGSRMQSTRN